MRAATDSGTSGTTHRMGGMFSVGGGSPVSAAKHIAASCHWSLATVGTHGAFSSSGAGVTSDGSGRSPGGITPLGTAHSQPISQTRPVGVTHVFSAESAPCTMPPSCRYASADPVERRIVSMYASPSVPMRRDRAPTVSPAIQRRR